MQLAFWSTDSFSSYEVAKAAGGVYTCDAPAYDDEVARYGFNGGILCDAMNAVWAALRCVGATGVKAVLIDDNGNPMTFEDD